MNEGNCSPGTAAYRRSSSPSIMALARGRVPVWDRSAASPSSPHPFSPSFWMPARRFPAAGGRNRPGRGLLEKSAESAAIRVRVSTERPGRRATALPGGRGFLADARKDGQARMRIQGRRVPFPMTLSLGRRTSKPGAGPPPEPNSTVRKSITSTSSPCCNRPRRNIPAPRGRSSQSR